MNIFSLKKSIKKTFFVLLSLVLMLITVGVPYSLMKKVMLEPTGGMFILPGNDPIILLITAIVLCIFVWFAYAYMMLFAMRFQKDHVMGSIICAVIILCCGFAAAHLIATYVVNQLMTPS